MLNCFFRTSSCITENTSTTVHMATTWDSFTPTMTAVYYPIPFLRSETLYLGSIMVIFRTPDPISILNILPNLKLPLLLSLVLWLEQTQTGTFFYHTDQRSHAEISLLNILYFPYRTNGAVISCLAYPRWSQLPAQVFLHPSKGTVWAFPKRYVGLFS